jgi:hypothetical protein
MTKKKNQQAIKLKDMKKAGGPGETTPWYPFAPAQRRLQGPPAKSKFLADGFFIDQFSIQ